VEKQNSVQGGQVNVSVQTKIKIANETFQGGLTKFDEETYFGAQWINENNRTIGIGELLKSIAGNNEQNDIELAECNDLDLTLQTISLTYQMQKKLIVFSVETNKGWKLGLSYCFNTKQFDLLLKCDLNIWDELPLVKEVISNGEVTLHAIRISYNSKDGMSGKVDLDCKLGEAKFTTSDEKPTNLIKDFKQSSNAGTEVTKKENIPKSNSPVSWMELNKKIGPIFLRRIGFAFQGGKVRLCLDADVTISILKFSVLEGYIGIKLGNELEFEGGIKGFMLTLNKPPLFISGGLYLDDNSKEANRLYNGALTIVYKDFAIRGIGSYGKLKEGKKNTFFAFVMVDYPIGGAPCFYITGLCGGFGVNRKIIIPEVDKVREFPFIQMMLSEKKKEDDMKDKKASDILEDMNSVIAPCEDMNFMTAGIKFKSFEMVETVAIINIAFGKKIECSLLGVTELYIPPRKNSADNTSPIVYACLNLRGFFCPDDGIVFLDGALSDDSYLLSKNCKITGGFAFYSWFGGEYAGDFVISVGGYAPGFERGHYPAVDRIGINWRINDNLSASGSGYFALIPSGLMAGGEISFDYELGSLKAYFRAAIDLFLKFKPFFYKLSVYIRVGVSCELDFGFFSKKISVEIGADLSIKGPEFSGKATIYLAFFSFTISFNDEAEEPKPLSFEEFYQQLLPKFSGGAEGKMNAHYELGSPCTQAKLARLIVNKGLLGEKECPNEGSKRYFIDIWDIVLNVESAMPLKHIYVNNTNEERKSEENFGIVPSGITNLESTLSIEFKRGNKVSKEIYSCLIFEELQKNLPSALWFNGTPNKKQGLMKGMMVGLKIVNKEIELDRILPEEYKEEKEKNGEGYDLQVLEENEKCKLEIKSKFLKPIDDSGDEIYTKSCGEVMDTMFEENKEREKILEHLDGYGLQLKTKVDVGNFNKYRRILMNAPFNIRPIGVRREEYAGKN